MRVLPERRTLLRLVRLDYERAVPNMLSADRGTDTTESLRTKEHISSTL